MCLFVMVLRGVCGVFFHLQHNCGSGGTAGCLMTARLEVQIKWLAQVGRHASVSGVIR